MRERLTTSINDLPERERLIMTLYYYEETTMKEIGIILGVVESWISQIHASAVLHLRARLANPRPDQRTLTTTPGSKHPRNRIRPKLAVQLPIRSTTDTHDLKHVPQMQ
jgi:RNA polymerase sigma factor FliA